MKSPLLLIALTYLITLIAGCSNEDPNPKSKRDGSGFGLIGVENTNWQRPCESDEEGQISKKRFIKLYSTTAVHTLNYYDGVACDSKLMRVSYVRTYVEVMKEVTPELKGWETFYFNLGTYLAVIKKVSLLKNFNYKKRYEYSDWQLNVGKEISGRRWDTSSEAETEMGAPRSNTLKLEDDKLYFSDYKNGRPVASDDYYYTKMK